MSGYQIEIDHRAQRYMERLVRGDRRAAQRIDQAIKELESNPRPAGCTKLVGAAAWRIKVSGYRVIYTIDDAAQTIRVTKVGTRQNFYDR